MYSGTVFKYQHHQIMRWIMWSNDDPRSQVYIKNQLAIKSIDDYDFSDGLTEPQRRMFEIVLSVIIKIGIGCAHIYSYTQPLTIVIKTKNRCFTIDKYGWLSYDVRYSSVILDLYERDKNPQEFIDKITSLINGVL